MRSPCSKPRARRRRPRPDTVPFACRTGRAEHGMAGQRPAHPDRSLRRNAGLMAQVGVQIRRRAACACRWCCGTRMAAGSRCRRLAGATRRGLGILTARGWTWRDKWSLLRASSRWRSRGSVATADLSVADLSARPDAARARRADRAAMRVGAEHAGGSLQRRGVPARAARLAVQDGHADWADLLLPRAGPRCSFSRTLRSRMAGEANGATLRIGTRVRAIARKDGEWAVDGRVLRSGHARHAPGDAARLVA
jgi:hypothetical protein